MKKLKIVVIIIITIFIKTVVFANYSGITCSSNSMKIAKPIIDVIEHERLLISNSNLSGYFDFEVRNYDKYQNINEAQLSYDIEMQLDETNLKTFKLVKIDQQTGREEEQELNDLKSSNHVLQIGTMQNDYYRIYVEYNDTSMNVFGRIWMRVIASQSEVN